MTRRAASGFGWQRKSESGDGSLSLEDGPAAIFTDEKNVAQGVRLQPFYWNGARLFGSNNPDAVVRLDLCPRREV